MWDMEPLWINATSPGIFDRDLMFKPGSAMCDLAPSADGSGSGVLLPFR